MRVSRAASSDGGGGKEAEEPAELKTDVQGLLHWPKKKEGYPPLKQGGRRQSNTREEESGVQ